MYTVEEREQRLAKYYKADISLGHDKWLVFERVVNYEGYDDNEAIELRLFDKPLQTNTLLGTFRSGRWESPSNRSAKDLWKIIKTHEVAVKHILDRLRTPLHDLKPVIFEWRCLKRRFQLQSIKIKRKLKNFKNESI